MIKKQAAYHGGQFFTAVGSDFSTLIKSQNIINADVLDAWFDPSPKVLKKVKQFLPYILKTSPPTHSEGLIQTISKYRDVPTQNIAVSGGSSDLMYSFFPHFLRKGQKVLILDPMYGEYAHILQYVVGAKIIRLKLSATDNFRPKIPDLTKTVSLTKPTMIILVNPNSPTGQYLKRAELTKFIKSIPKTLVVVDETYIDYVSTQESLERDASRLGNLVVIKSMSKAYGLSGARVGYLVASKNIINELSLYIAPWSVSLVGQVAGVEGLKDEKYYKQRQRQTNLLRKRLIRALATIPRIKIYPSLANFVLIELLDKHHRAQSLVKQLQKLNIFVRNCDSQSKQFHDRFIRIAVKDQRTNDKIVKAIKQVL